MKDGEIRMGSFTKLYVSHKEDIPIASIFASLLCDKDGKIPSICYGDPIKNDSSYVQFRHIYNTDSMKSFGSYTIKSESRGIVVESFSNIGLFYAVQTMRQVLIQSQNISGANGTVYYVRKFDLTDYPRFSYRGLMLDVSRFFMPKEGVKKIIDAMSLLKLNFLHLHLTDDNGWRIEIKKYPLLTKVGAYRVDRDEEFFSHRRNQRPGEKATSGGYYTQADLKEIVKYAQDRKVTIIPEIDIPAHSNAALAAYPEYACESVHKKITVLPGIGEDHYPIIFCAGKDKTFDFIKDILDEVMDIFPSEYIHIGGDEANKTYWKKCKDCQRRIKEEHLKDEEDLQGYFMDRIGKYIMSKGRKFAGWDEVTDFDIPKDVTVYSWRGTGSAAIKAARSGHDYIMTPAKTMYLIRYQGPQWFEPMTYFGNSTLSNVYHYDPVDPSFTDKEISHLLGVQASMWTEFCRSPQDVFYMIFPRLLALSEVAWSPAKVKNYNNFLVSMDKFLPLLKERNINYALSMYNVQHHVIPKNGAVEVSLSCDRPDMEIRYTTDDNFPSEKSSLYVGPIKIFRSQVLQAAVFSHGKMMGKVLRLPLSFSKATGAIARLNMKDLPELTNAVRGSIRQSDFEWVRMSSDDTSTIILDLGEKESVSTVTLGILNNYAMAVHPPKQIEVAVSVDGNNYRTVAIKNYDQKKAFVDNNSIIDENFSFPSQQKIRYISIKSTPWGFVPSYHVRVLKKASIYYDEIRVK